LPAEQPKTLPAEQANPTATEQPNKWPVESKKKGKTNRKKKCKKSREFVEDSSDDLWISLSEPELDIPDTSVTYPEADKPNSPFTTHRDK